VFNIQGFNVVEMYKKGYSIDFIIDSYYKWKTKDDKNIYRQGDIFILKRKSITKEESKKEVYREIYNYIK